MNTVPRSWVWAAAIVLSLTAVGSLVIGATRGGPGRDAVSDIGQLAPVPEAALAKPIADLTAEDARFRQIAREEAQAALAKTAAPPRPRPAPKPDADSSDDDRATLSAGANDSSSTPAAHTPAAIAKPVAATAASVAGQRALLGSAAHSSTSARSSSTPTASPD